MSFRHLMIQSLQSLQEQLAQLPTQDQRMLLDVHTTCGILPHWSKRNMRKIMVMVNDQSLPS